MKKPKVIPVALYTDRKKETRVKITALNGRVLFVSSESYKRKIDAEKALRVTFDILANYFAAKNAPTGDEES